MEKIIRERIEENVEVNKSVIKVLPQIEKAARSIIYSLKRGGKVVIFGNGGSAGDAQHFAAELIGKFKGVEKPLSAIALTTDTSVLTSIGNDFSFIEIFSRQVEAIINKKDVVIGISTSGHSSNVQLAMSIAKDVGAKRIALMGDGGVLDQCVDVAIKVPSNDTQHIQEAHIMIIHILCELIKTNVK